MKTRDLFAGCSVTIAPYDDVWLILLNTDDGQTIATQTYREVPDALKAVHEWMLMLSDEAELSDDAAGAADLMRQVLARMAVGDETLLPETVDEAPAHDELRTWFEREMGRE